MKRFLALFIAMLFLCTLVACGKNATNKENKPSANGYLDNSINLWSEEDFLLYNAEGEIISNTSSEENYLSSTEGSMTKRGVSIGTNAIEALSRYDLCYEMSAYSHDGQLLTLTEETDLEGLVKSGQEITIFVMFDEYYQSINVCEYIAAYQPENPYAAIVFKIHMGIIKDVGVSLK